MGSLPLIKTEKRKKEQTYVLFEVAQNPLCLHSQWGLVSLLKGLPLLEERKIRIDLYRKSKHIFIFLIKASVFIQSALCSCTHKWCDQVSRSSSVHRKCCKFELLMICISKCNMHHQTSQICNWIFFFIHLINYLCIYSFLLLLLVFLYSHKTTLWIWPETTKVERDFMKYIMRK